jgi:hypothetical protein
MPTPKFKEKDAPQKRVLVLAVCIILAAALFVLYSSRNQEPDHKSSTWVNDVDACVYSRNMVKALLLSPGSAEFPSDACNARVQGNTVSISSYVDSQNGFGAKLRTPYAWTGRYDSTAKKWAVDYFALGNKIVIADGKPASP